MLLGSMTILSDCVEGKTIKKKIKQEKKQVSVHWPSWYIIRQSLSPASIY